MVHASFSLREDYWEDFTLQEEDISILYDFLLELGTPLPPDDLVVALVESRIQMEKEEIEKKRLAGGKTYMPKEQYEIGQKVVFPALDWRQAEVMAMRPGQNPEYEEFGVIEVQFDNGEKHEFAAEFDDHVLNEPEEEPDEHVSLSQSVLDLNKDLLIKRLELGLKENPNFVYIAGCWFPRALLVNVNTGHLNLAEAVLDMAGDAPLPTAELLEQVELPSNENLNLLEFSLDLALQEDDRFDEVGPAGKVMWYLRRLEPQDVREKPLYLRYQEIEYNRNMLTPAMLDIENSIDDELTPDQDSGPVEDEVVVRLLFPHWRAGTLPLTPRLKPLFPTAYESPRIRFMLVDGDSGDKFPGWVVREEQYVLGLEKWYHQKELMPGSIVRVRPGEQQGEVIVHVDAQRSRRDWVRTILVGADGGMVFATLKQVVSAAYDEHMGIMVADTDVLDEMWKRRQKRQPPFERVVADMARELVKMNPQNHVHVTELYAAVNLVRRCPPGPVMALLSSRPWFVHVGDLHFRFDDSAG
ncbi:MAG: hypothetical protein U9Q82_04350 [Chloroflexota bacterium]|nr:hypothetical protein [Chloroflexota bacterium]